MSQTFSTGPTLDGTDHFLTDGGVFMPIPAYYCNIIDYYKVYSIALYHIICYNMVNTGVVASW